MTILATMMSNKKETIIVSVLLLLLLAYPLILSQEVTDPVDPVLKFYVNQAASTFQSTSPELTGLKYSYIGRTYYKSMTKEGRVKKLDSAIIKYFHSFGQLDSTHEIIKTNDRLNSLDFTVPEVFNGNYLYNFYPNDTGGENLAIGFDADTSVHNIPVGFSIIDRGRYQLRWLYLFYPDKEDHRRYSRCFRFTEKEGRVFPDSVWVVGSRFGIFSVENYRIETGFDSLTIYK